MCLRLAENYSGDPGGMAVVASSSSRQQPDHKLLRRKAEALVSRCALQPGSRLFQFASGDKAPGSWGGVSRFRFRTIL
jgi:hypothetical protein